MKNLSRRKINGKGFSVFRCVLASLQGGSPVRPFILKSVSMKEKCPKIS